MRSIPGGTSTAIRSPVCTPRPRKLSANDATRPANAASVMVSSAAASLTAIDPGAPCPMSDHSGAPTAEADGATLVWLTIAASTYRAIDASKTVRCPQSAMRWSSTLRNRPRRSSAKSSLNTGSREPHTRRTGMSNSGKRDATAAMSAADGCESSNGTSATKPATPSRRPAPRYGAANARRCRRVSERPGRNGVPRTNSGEVRVVRRCTPVVAANLISHGALRPDGTATPVFDNTRPDTRDGWATAKPIAIAPPQSCATNHTGPSKSSASKRSSMSRTRSAYEREPTRCE